MTLNTGLFTSASPEWYTPPDLMEQIQAFLGVDYFDPCQAPDKIIGERVDGLSCPWHGHVYVNPPYGRGIGHWVEKALAEPLDEVILLLPARTDTRWFQPLFAYPLLFIRGRLHFSGGGSAPFPSVLAYKGSRTRAFVLAFQDWGSIVCPITISVLDFAA